MNWAINKSKLDRAIKYAKDQAKEGDEKVIKARYIELGGKLASTSNPKKNVAKANPVVAEKET